MIYKRTKNKRACRTISSSVVHPHTLPRTMRFTFVALVAVLFVVVLASPAPLEEPVNVTLDGREVTCYPCQPAGRVCCTA
jgi:hypothetical protein